MYTYDFHTRTHIDFHSFDGKRFDLRLLVGHEPVELVPALVPLDAVQGVPTQVVAAGQVRGLALLEELWDPDAQIGQAVNHWKKRKE